MLRDVFGVGCLGGGLCMHWPLEIVAVVVLSGELWSRDGVPPGRLGASSCGSDYQLLGCCQCVLGCGVPCHLSHLVPSHFHFLE